MGLFTKIKGIFIEDVPEDEYDDDDYEIEKKPEKEVMVAKKIENKEDLSEKLREKRVDREHKETLDLDIKDEDESKEKEEVTDETKEFDKPSVNEFKFPFSDDDFKVEDEPKKEVETEPKIEKEEPKETTVLYHQTSYTKVDDGYKETGYHEIYENNGTREEKHMFKRSPIISPVWGILDKNYKKEDVVSKREIRLTTNNGKADLDAVREKAYGDIANDITASIEEDRDKDMTKEKEPITKDNLLYDLSEGASPSVKDVTVGDAEEYYEDLGLEYNVDYKVDKEEPVEDEEEKELVKDNLEKDEVEETKEEPIDEDDEDDNLFDLIDSMYEDKE